MDSGFHNQEPGFWITIMVGFRIPLAGFRIPKPWIPDSTDQNYLDSGLPYMGSWIPDSTPWVPDSMSVDSGFHVHGFWTP